MWKFLVKQQKIEVIEREVIADHQIAFVNLKFTFDGDWKKFHKVVQFSQCDEVYSIVLGFDGTSCKLPAELHAGAVQMSVFGYDAESDTTVRATTVPITLNIRHSGFVGDDDTPIPPTPDLYTQLLQKISEIQAGVNGKDGLSAYEIAVENGFVGTVSEWLKSLKGADGLPGNDGINGIDGHDGADGQNGVDGQNGADGKNGLSAYELAVQGGYTGTVEEWLQSITPDLSPYITRVEVLKIVDDKVDSSAPDLSPYVTRVETQKLVESKFQTVESDLTALENTVNSEIQAVKDSVEPVVSQAHWHHNLTLLNSLTSAKIAKWDKISDIDIELQQLRDSTQYDQQNQNDEILKLENRISFLESQLTNGNNTVTLFSAGTDIFDLHDKDILLLLNNGTYTLISFVEQYPEFCSSNTQYTLNYSYDVLGWDTSLLAASAIAVKITPNSKIAMEYLSAANESGMFYLVAVSGRGENVPIADHIFNKIKVGDCFEVSFEWLYSADFITMLTSCENVPSGEYYLAWTGRSNNSHPKIKSIKIMEGRK